MGILQPCQAGQEEYFLVFFSPPEQHNKVKLNSGQWSYRKSHIATLAKHLVK